MRSALVAFLFLLPLVGAQAHEHGAAGPVVITTDLGPSMIAHVGSPVHFAILALGDDVDPDFHVDIPVRVTLNNVILWETTMLSGHDYDGINTLDVVFPAAGAWEVAAMTDGKVQTAIHGTVIDVPLRQAELLLTAPRSATTGAPVTFTYEIVDGGRVNHTDALIEVFKAGQLWFRTHTHTHTEAQSISYAFTEAGTYTVRVTGYTAFPGSAASVAPVVAESTLVVVASPSRMPTVPSMQQPAAKNVVVHGTADAPFELLGTFDPFTIVGQQTVQHLNAVVIDPETRMPVQHVDFEATLNGPRGVLFSSQTLHEYDGIFELALRSADLGEHTLTLTATRGDWKGAMSMTYLVAPPAMATVFGPQTVAFTHGDAQAGIPTDGVLRVAGLGDRPFAHGEIEFELRSPEGLTLVRNKLHTHADGTFPFTATAAGEGRHTLVLTPFPLDPQPVTGYGSLAFALDVGAGPGIQSIAAPLEPVTEAVEVPAAPVALLFLGLVALARRR